MNLVDNKEIVQRARIAYHVVETVFDQKKNLLAIAFLLCTKCNPFHYVLSLFEMINP